MVRSDKPRSISSLRLAQEDQMAKRAEDFYARLLSQVVVPRSVLLQDDEPPEPDCGHPQSTQIWALPVT
ncbi:hypothetical protein AVEN_1381-1 [Araneus ventricosus]|uniref:Uncharacterized protein n=1 Tax=Araneus ventricosus TaxID=182803 RepID=A0A4Y2LW80_ARAVE|nr:hypothetical protein AVEN_1381-1 [Araneus ventricosus]